MPVRDTDTGVVVPLTAALFRPLRGRSTHCTPGVLTSLLAAECSAIRGVSSKRTVSPPANVGVLLSDSAGIGAGYGCAGGRREIILALVAPVERVRVNERALENPLPMGMVMPWTMIDVMTRKYTTGRITLLSEPDARVDVPAKTVSGAVVRNVLEGSLGIEDCSDT